ncbi:DEAD/DEAH box helicase [Arthrobacter flavus]|uniref:DEAD/DEAH box helicase family protein n=1 Tax=Arthrobacter flavus TaxID=95172 RepID=A0ABW4Q7R0_9MICC
MSESGELNIDHDLLALIKHQMQLRQPNAEAVEDIATAISDHIDRLGRSTPFEGVVDSATGVGKTYVLAATIDYLAQSRGWNNFVIVVPGRTILTKTIANFTPGSPRDLTNLLGVKTVLVTSENFDTPEMASIMDDSTIVKVYVLTVQTLIQPTTKVNRRTRTFTEGLGAEFYEWLVNADDLVVLADEHHLYYGEKFSDAVRGLIPRAIVGLTATPSSKTPADHIIYKYPLSAAIADKFVKTPVIVGRKDDRTDTNTALNDGITLLEVKRTAQDAYLAQNPTTSAVNPFMLVVARNTAEADELAEYLRSDDFRDGAYAHAVLQVDSSVTEDKEPDMWGKLSRVDLPTSPIRVVVSVAMLKEGWDVKSVYVLLSTQPSLSNVLTEQVLGRGLRLPYGKYTGVEMLDTLEVLAHERFAALLDRAGVLNEELVSFRTRTIVTTDQNNEIVVRTVTEETGRAVSPSPSDTQNQSESVDPNAAGQDPAATPDANIGSFLISEVDARETAGTAETEKISRTPITLQLADPEIILPKITQRPVAKKFSLSDITTDAVFVELGKSLRSNPDDELRRIRLTAVRVQGPDGVWRSETRQVTAADAISSKPTLDLPLELSRIALISHVMDLPMVDSSSASRSVEKANAGRLVDALIEGLGDQAPTLLSAFGGRAAVRLARLIQAEQRKVTPGIGYEEQIGFAKLAPSRNLGTRVMSDDRRGSFSKTTAYEGWAKSRMSADWFDSEPERALALIADEAKEVQWWMRLAVGDLTIAWGSGQLYNPDFLVAEDKGVRILLEVKADNQMLAEDVQAKRHAARKWVNYVNGLKEVQTREEKWSYVLVSSSDIKQVNGSWDALKRLG